MLTIAQLRELTGDSEIDEWNRWEKVVDWLLGGEPKELFEFYLDMPRLTLQMAVAGVCSTFEIGGYTPHLLASTLPQEFTWFYENVWGFFEHKFGADNPYHEVLNSDSFNPDVELSVDQKAQPDVELESGHEEKLCETTQPLLDTPPEPEFPTMPEVPQNSWLAEFEDPDPDHSVCEGSVIEWQLPGSIVDESEQNSVRETLPPKTAGSVDVVSDRRSVRGLEHSPKILYQFLLLYDRKESYFI